MMLKMVTEEIAGQKCHQMISGLGTAVMLIVMLSPVREIGPEVE